MKELWVEKYRPTSVKDYVFRDDKQKKQVSSWVESGAIPHLLFSGAAGTGKTTLAKVLLNELDVDDGDVMFINASSENNVDTMTNQDRDFASWGAPKAKRKLNRRHRGPKEVRCNSSF